MPCIAYDENLPLIREFVQHVFGEAADMRAVATAPDLRLLLEMAKGGTGWTVLPDYLCEDALLSGQLVELPTSKEPPANTLYLAWNKGALRHPRIVYVRDFLLHASERISRHPDQRA